MMKTIKQILLFSLLLLIAAQSMAQTVYQTYFVYTEGDKWGLKHKNGSIIIPAKFNNPLGPSYYKNGEEIVFTDGVGAISLSGHKIGLIDTLGNAITPFKYRRITRFSDGLAIAVLDKSVDIINTKGQIINSIPYKVKEPVALAFNQGIGILYGFYNSNKLTIINKEKIISTFKVARNHAIKVITPELLGIRDGYKGYNQYYRLYDTYGNLKSEEMFGHVEAPNEYGLMRASKGWGSNTTYGYIDRNAKEVILFVHNQGLSNISKNGIFWSSGSLYNLNNEIIKEAGIDTTFIMLSKSDYYLYGNPSQYRHYNSKNFNDGMFRGIMDDKFNIITPEIFMTNYLRTLDRNTFVYRINNKTFTIAPDGSITPGNGSLEYENALAALPDHKELRRVFLIDEDLKRATTRAWILPNTYLKLAAAKNYTPALKMLDSLYNDANYAALHPDRTDIYNANLEKDALAGDVNSMHTLGIAYLNGSSRYPKNPAKGIPWLQQAANKNHQQAAYELLYHYIKNHDENKAQQFLNSYKGPKETGAYRFQDLYQPGGLQAALGLYSDQNEQLQDAFYTRAISIGNIEAAYSYGKKLIYSGNSDKITKGLNILHDNIAKDDVDSMMLLGEYYGTTATDKARIDLKKSNEYYNMALRSSKINFYQKAEASAAINNNTR